MSVQNNQYFQKVTHHDLIGNLLQKFCHLIKGFVRTRDTAGLHCFGIMRFYLAAQPQLKLTASPGMICPENTPGRPNAYAPGIPHLGYSM
jgi:hypothetical protein